MTKKSGPGCITTYGIILALLAALAIAGFGFAKGGMLFNPGALNAQPGPGLRGQHSHAEFTNQCDQCHAPFWSGSSMADRCLVCHSDVSIQLLVPFSMHARLSHEAPALTCRNCHSEHHGPEAALTDINVVPFPHDAVGYSLVSHQTKTDKTPFVCKDCHPQTDQKFDQAACNDCHKQMAPIFMQTHGRDFGSNCMACHGGLDHYDNKFTHTGVPFLLTGKHIQVPCGQCHPNNYTMQELKSTPQDCNSCHGARDPHQGRFGIDCGSCHTTTAWLPASFDHNLSVFKLTGKHSTTACESCHKNAVYKGIPTDCNSCHAADDEHRGNLGPLCGDCHTTTNWTPLPFDHNQSVFKLTGKHSTLACESCHINGVLKGTPGYCISCHAGKDIHKGNLGSLCGNCHTTNNWTPAPFDHNQFAFQLSGKHAALACESCHINGVLADTPNDCISCHAEKDRHNGNLGPKCGKCHTTNNWSPRPFDHSKFAFKLTGKHTSLNCENCHKKAVFKGTPSDCISCHSKNDSHKGSLGSNCAACHTTSGWKPSIYDHNLSSFKLTGKHAALACASCHINGVYKGTPGDCNSCHAKDDSHNGSLGGNCSACHNTSAWKPSIYDHNLSSFKLTGKHATLACASCHINGVFKGTPGDCISCHAKDDSHNGSLGSNCAACHTTSAWKPSTYDHNQSGFPLTGVHASLGCAQCHAGGVFTGLSPDCVSCHAEPQDFHSPGYGPYCGSCHTTTNWTAQFTHPGSCDVGVNCDFHGALDCNQCHINGDLGSISCVHCHSSNTPPVGMKTDLIKLAFSGRPVGFPFAGSLPIEGVSGIPRFSFK
jgi:hypothetical protein